MPQLQKTDKTLFYTTVFLSFFGLVMVYSASSVMAQLRYHSSTHFFWQQAIALGASLAAMMVLKRLHYRKLQSAAVAMSALGLALISLGVVYLVDNRFHRWIRVAGVSLQPAEFAKPAIVLFLAYFVAHRARAINSKHTLWPALMAVGVVTIAVGVADLGTAIVILAPVAAVFFVAGLERRYLVGLAVVAVLVVCAAVVVKPYRLARVVQFFDADYEFVSMADSSGKIKRYLQTSLTTRDTNYQAAQSKIAIGAGGPFGLGLMQSKQKLFYLPEAHTDFIYAVICEEWGLAGALGVLAGFGLIFWRGIRTTLHSQDDFARYLALAITSLLVFQALFNMTVVLAMTPTKGIPLPMISAGGSSLLSTLSMLGMLMNVGENGG